MHDRHVLILSTLADAATDDVVRRLTQFGIPFKRLNTENYPFSSTLTFRPDKTNRRDWIAVDGEPIPVPYRIWYRRVRSPAKPDGMDDGVYTFCLQENRAALLGSIVDLPGPWMSHPAAVWQAEHKPFQLTRAAELGLRIPRTVVTNDPLVIRKAFSEFQEMVVKPVRTGYIVHKGQEFAIFTSRVMEQHLEELESARWSPAIYQALIPKRFDLRITIIGRKIFAAAIDSQSDPAATLDWRQTNNPRLPHLPFTLPEEIATRLFRLMDSLRLTFGAIDMIQDPDGEYVFLEVNPSGQWLWLDDMLQLGISDAVAEWLAGGRT
ncbi:MAG: MvdD family ATP-grasp ribosomal peptide maturase [Acidobacteriia bacterium]|nr:MvdD family ATP-grasp ribosomal peptide maturase [Terriglobia bacterium]